MAERSGIHYNLEGELVAHVSAQEYLINKEAYLQKVDQLSIYGTIKAEQAPGLFQHENRLSESRVKTIDISELHSDTPVESTAEMFKGNKNLEKIVGIESFGAMKDGVEHVTDMHEMFAGCSSLKSLNLGAWKPSVNEPKQMASMAGMFKDCASLESVTFECAENGSQVINWHGAKNMAEMFKDCKSLTELDVSAFTAYKRPMPEDVCDFAAGCDKLRQVSLPIFMSSTDREERAISRETMFHGDHALRYLSGGNETIQKDQGRFLEGALRNEGGYSYQQAANWAKTVVSSELNTMSVVRRGYMMEYLDELEARNVTKSAEKQDRIHGESMMSRGQMAESQFGHIGGVDVSFEPEAGK